ncbi:phage tail domain-containing protein [Brachybacterium sp. GPGPB12]|uniref:phage distal tail protein n=1 Tax=Brachybacterium sp. GPGPB12 TaxID=3023517 RepID=UPI0031343574
MDIASTDRITGDGSIVRGVRYGAREVYLPLLMESDSVAGLSRMRRELNRLLAPHLGPVEIRIEDPATGTDRMIRGYYREGLDGDFGDGFHGSWQTLGLTFECPDPWWLGPEQTVELRVNPGSKPFLSDTVPFFPVILAQSTVQGRFDVTIEGDGPVWPAWEVLGPGTDLVIARGTDRIEIAGTFSPTSPVLIDTAAGRITPDRWADTSLRSRLFSLDPGQQSLTVTLVSATPATLVRLTYRERYLEGV